MRIPTMILAALTLAAMVAAQGRMARTLDLYLIDVEGGNATLFVAPSGESLLVDTGNGGQGAVRDAERILAAATGAGISRIDHLITTHYHGDHFGAMAELAGRIDIGHLIDNDVPTESVPTASGDHRDDVAQRTGGTEIHRNISVLCDLCVSSLL